MAASFGLFGAGKLGTSFAFALASIGEKIEGVNDNDAGAADQAAKLLKSQSMDKKQLTQSAEILLIAVPDREIKIVAEEISDYVKDDTLLVHFSAILPSKVLIAPLSISAHPVKSFPDTETIKDAFNGVTFSLEGTQSGIDLFRPYLDRLGARYFTISPDVKPLYHVVCTMSSNLVVGLLDCAFQMGHQANIPEKELTYLITSLAQQTIRNASEKGSFSKALSGPIERGDLETVKRHLEVLEDYSEQRRIYMLLSNRLLEVARMKGTGSEILSKLKSILSKERAP